jgi:hypothetical protein
MNIHKKNIEPGWWFGTMEFCDFPSYWEESSSQLTFTPSFFKGVGIPPTRNTWEFVDHME